MVSIFNSKSFLTLTIGGLLVTLLLSLIILRAASFDLLLVLLIIPGVLAGIVRSKPWWTSGFLGFILGVAAAVGIEILLTHFNDVVVTSIFNQSDWLVQISYLMIIPALNALVGILFSVAINRENPFQSIEDPNFEVMRQTVGGVLVASILLLFSLNFYVNMYLTRGGSFPVSSLMILFFSSFLIGSITVLIFHCTLNIALKVGVIAPLVANSVLVILDLTSRPPLETGGEFGYGLRGLFFIVLAFVTLTALIGGALFGGFIDLNRGNR